jgi:hypothetical protein
LKLKFTKRWEVSVKQRENQDTITLSQQEAINNVLETVQLRRAKLHASCLLDGIDSKKLQNPALRELLEATLVLQTTSDKVLAVYLHR